MDKNGWRVMAIIFLIVAAVEFLVLVYSYNTGIEIIQNEEYCSASVCDLGGYDAYYYEIETKICYCYLGEDIAYTERL